jgi:single-stranded-DNA-specific exonuclease
MTAAKELFLKFGGHAAAGGFTFPEENEQAIRERLGAYAESMRSKAPGIWESKLDFDCELPAELLSLSVMDTLDGLKPFGHGFEEPKFKLSLPVKRVQYFFDKVTGAAKHSCLHVSSGNRDQKILFFNDVLTGIEPNQSHSFVVSFSRNTFRGTTSLSIMGHDWRRDDL